MHSIIPSQVFHIQSVGAFILTEKTQIIFSDTSLKSEADLLKNYIELPTGFNLITTENYTKTEGNIILKKTEESSSEAYSLKVDTKNVIITGSKAGIMRAIQTLRQLFPVEIYSDKEVKNIKWTVPCCEINDYPAFKWRGMHLDVSRHFFTKDEVKRFIEQIAIHKFNILHLHLTDDQGWRIQIKKYPKLTEIASKRSCTLIGHESARPRKYDNMEYQGFYTQKEMKEIIEFAAKRHITVVPEIDMPGHMQAAIHAYPELGCNNLDEGVRSHWGISQHILNPFDNTVNFMKDVLSEIIELFPSEFIHIGGDEAHKYEWCESKAVQLKMTELGAKNEDQLQSWFIRQMDEFISSKGRRLIGWDEILEGGLAENAAVMSWRGEQGGIEAAKMKHEVVMTPGSHTYFDHYQKQPVENEPLAIGGFTSLEKVYSWQPVPEVIRNTEFSKYILGGQGQLWSEYIENRDKLDYMAFPRICALSEVLWLPEKLKDFENFSDRMEIHKKRMEILKINYCK